jgi:3-dehydroquinate dehydratase-2
MSARAYPGLTRKVLVINGSNLNMLGTREPELYGRATLEDVRQLCERTATSLGLEIDFRQSNHEGVLLDWVHEAHAMRSAVVINPGAYARTSLALHDAVKAVQVPVIEIHITNTYQRESYRPPSYLSRAALGVVCGFGVQVYRYGLIAVADLMEPT